MTRTTRFIALLLALGAGGLGCGHGKIDPTAEFNRGVVYFKQGKYSKATSCFQRSLQAAQPTAQALNFLGVCELYDGQRAAGIQHLEQALQLEPSYVPTQFNLALAKLEAGK